MARNYTLMGYDMSMKTKKTPYDKFMSALKKVMSVSHAEVQSRMEAEKKMRKSKRPSAVSRAVSEKG